jgi:hypothetical protein
MKIDEYLHRSGFKTFNQVQSQGGPMDSNAPIKKIGTSIHIFNISSIESLGPTQELGLRGGFETTSNEKFDRVICDGGIAWIKK